MRYSILAGTLQQVKDVGAKNIKEASSVKIIFADLDKEQVSKLKAMGCIVAEVAAVRMAIFAPVLPPTPVTAAPIYTPQELSWVVGLEDIRELMDPPLYGEGFNLAMLDTGIRKTHEQIRGRVVYSKNYTASPDGDGFNHGTGTVSIALTLAPQCNILDMKVLDDEGNGTEEAVVLAIDDCIALRDTDPEIAPSVINISLGAEDDGNPDNPMRVACRAAVSEGIYVFAAAGNGGPNPGTILSPACERYVFAVGSSSYSPFAVSSFSSRGPTEEGLVKPEGLMFGEDIIVASSDSDTATKANSGTSFSTPFWSGVTILYHEGVQRQAVAVEPLVGLTPTPAFWITPERMIDHWGKFLCVKPKGSLPGKDNSYGYGLPFGPLLTKALGFGAGIDLSAMISMMMMIGMIGIVMKAMK